MLTPLELRNGVYVRLRGPVDLQDGDYILIGKQVLRYELLTDTERDLHAAVEHGVVLFGTPVRPPWARLRQITPAAITRDMYHLTKPRWSSAARAATSFFRKTSSCRDDTRKSSLRAGRGRLEDLGSSNGSFIRLRGPQGFLPAISFDWEMSSCGSR